MKKELKKKLIQDPKRYKHYKQKRREAYKRKMERIKNDPIRYEKFKKKIRIKSKKRSDERRKRRLEKRSASPYWQVEGHKRYKFHTFKKIARNANNRCKIGRITASELWVIAKKQGLVCSLTGQKLTTENISLDHIIPIVNGGTNHKENLRFVTFAANTAKSYMTDDEFYSFCQNIINYHNKCQ